MTAFNAGSTANYPSLLNQLGSKNVIVNGGFTVNQRGYVSGAVLASGAYGHDGWKGGASGGDYSFTQLPYNTQITIAANKTLIRVIEDKFVVGGTYILAWTGTALARYAVNSATPAGSYAASPIVISGQTAGTTMSVEFGNGASTGTLGDVMLEVGTVAPSNFEYRMHALEQMLCQRYCYKIGGAASIPVALGQANSTTQGRFLVPLPVPMRIAPTGVTVANVTNFSAYDPTARVSSAIAFGVAGPNTVWLDETHAAGSANVPLILRTENANASIIITGADP